MVVIICCIKKAPASAGACLIPFCKTMRFMVGSGAAGVSVGVELMLVWRQDHEVPAGYEYGADLVVKLASAMK